MYRYFVSSGLIFVFVGNWLKQDIARYSLRLQPDYRAWDRPTGGSDNVLRLLGLIVTAYHVEIEITFHLADERTALYKVF